MDERAATPDGTPEHRSRTCKRHPSTETDGRSHGPPWSRHMVSDVPDSRWGQCESVTFIHGTRLAIRAIAVVHYRWAIFDGNDRSATDSPRATSHEAGEKDFSVDPRSCVDIRAYRLRQFVSCSATESGGAPSTVAPPRAISNSSVRQGPSTRHHTKPPSCDPDGDHSTHPAVTADYDLRGRTLRRR